MECRVLSIQSHVVRGYVGNKSASFPLQVNATHMHPLSDDTRYRTRPLAEVFIVTLARLFCSWICISYPLKKQTSKQTAVCAIKSHKRRFADLNGRGEPATAGVVQHLVRPAELVPCVSIKP